MPDGGKLNLKVLFEAIDEMSGPLRIIGVNLDHMDKAAKAVGVSMRSMGAISVASLGGLAVGNKLTEYANGLSDAAGPLSEATTRLQQVTDAQQALIGRTDALQLVGKFGAATLPQEIDALTAAVQQYHNYDQALAAVAAASRLAVGTHQDLDSTLQMLMKTAANTGEPIDQLADKFANLNKLAGLSGDAGGRQMRQMQRAYEMAAQHKVSLDRFLATAAEAQRVLGEGAARDLQIYYEEDPNSRRHSARADAVRGLIDKHAQEIDALQKAIDASNGVSGALAAQSLGDPAVQKEHDRLVAQAVAAASGTKLLEQQGAFAQWATQFRLFEAEEALRHPALAGATADVSYALGTVISDVGRLGLGLVELSLLKLSAGPLKSLGAAVLARFGIGGAAESVAAPAVAAAAAPEAAAGGIGILGLLALGGIGVYGFEVAHQFEQLGESFGRGLRNFDGLSFGQEEMEPSPMAPIESTRNVDRRTHVEVAAPVRVEVTIHGDGQLDEQKLTDYITRAIESADEELKRQIAKVVADMHAFDARTDFDDGY